MSLLNLKGWNEGKVATTANDYRIDATYTGEPECCVKCGSTAGLYGHGTAAKLVMDVPTHGKRAGVTLTRKRYRCRDCKATFLQPVAQLNSTGTMTTRLVEHIERQSLTKTFSAVADDVGVDEKTVRNVFNAYVDDLDARIRFETPVVLGIDEVHLLKSARCVFTDVTKPAIIQMLEKRNKPDVIHYLQSIPDKSRIKVVTIDMWKPYRDAVQLVLPDAKVVIDKFHVVKLATGAVQSARTSLRDSMNATVKRKMMRAKWLLLKRRAQLKPENLQVLDEWLNTFPSLYWSYVAKESFFEIWDTAKTRDQAEASYDKWIENLNILVERHFKPLTTAMTNWRVEIFNYWDHPYTNAVTETLNGLIKMANRTGRGYSFRVLRAKVIYGRKVMKSKFGDRIQWFLVEPPDNYGFVFESHDMREIDRVLTTVCGWMLEDLRSKKRAAQTPPP